MMIPRKSVSRVLIWVTDIISPYLSMFLLTKHVPWCTGYSLVYLQTERADTSQLGTTEVLWEQKSIQTLFTQEYKISDFFKILV